MNRNEAHEYINQYVILDEGNQGKYISILKDIKTEPNKPWRAVLRITGVLTYPDINFSELKLIKPRLKNNDIIECSGQRIKIFNGKFDSSYDQSVSVALKDKWDNLHQISQNSEVLLSLIQQELRQLKHEYLIFEENYVYYQLVKKGRQIHIYDEDKKETLSIEGCPFEFEIKVNDEWVHALYDSGLTFELKNGSYVELSHGENIRLNKAQFDPYRILLNELEEPSLHALEKGLEEFGIGHEHCVYCHNSLLIELLSSFKKDAFSGVNFISYANSKNQFVVQHHYERSIHENDNEDVTYDRFEFTSDSGERVLTTYATQLK